MFDRTLDSSWNDRSRRGLTTLTSLGLQALAVAVLIAFPLLRPKGLPSFHQLSTPISWGQPVAAPPTPRARINATRPTSESVPEIVFTTPREIPKGVLTESNDPLPQIGGSDPSIPGAGPGDPNGVTHLFESTRPVLPVAG